MNFLSQYEAEIDFRKKKVKLYLDDSEKFTFEEGWVLNMMVNNIKAVKLLSKGCTSYLVHVVGKDDDSISNLQSNCV